MSEPTAIEVADLLDAACDALLVNGWRHGARLDAGPELCAVEALNVAEGLPATTEVYGYACGSVPRGLLGLAAQTALLASGFGAEPFFTGDACLWAWNDEPERTFDDVLDAFRLTAKQLREAC